MKHPDEERLAELAMKTVARQMTAAEHAELEALCARGPAAKAGFERHLAETRALAEATSLLDATESRTGELPGYARERLRTKVRETYGASRANPEPASQRPWWTWRLALGWASGLAVVALLTMTLLRPQEPVIQLALLDPVGSVRGGGPDALAALQSGWPKAKATAFKSADEVTSWKNGLVGTRGKDVVLVIYDRSAGELLVSGTKRGQPFERRFEVGEDLAPVLEQARRFLGEQ